MKSVRWLVVILILGISILRCSDGLLLQGESSLGSGYPISFTFSNSYPVAAMAFYMGIEDVNGDSKVDLVIAAGNWTYYRYNTTGAGVFGTSFGVSVSAGGNARGIVVADFNGDGFRDLATAANGAAAIGINTNNAGASFNAYSTRSTTAEPLDLGSGDFDQDGDVDLLTTLNSANQFCVLAGSGAATFTGCTNYAASTGPYKQVIDDFNKDGDLDVAMSHTGSGVVGVNLGSTGATFAAAVNYPISGAGNSIASGDFTKDGNLDLLVSKFSGTTTIEMLRGNGDGTFQAASTVATLGTVTNYLAQGDFNGDGLLDFAAVNSSDTQFRVFKNLGAGNFETTPTSFNTTCTTIGNIRARDLNNDGRLDIILICSIPSNQMQVYLHD